MAQTRKTTGAKKPAAKKPSSSTGSKKTSGSKSRSQSQSRSRSQSSQSRGPSKEQLQKLQELQHRRNQRNAIILFVFALFLLLLVIFPGESGWNAMHGFMWGTFGTWSILWPVLVIYIAVVTAKEQGGNSLHTRVLLSVLVLLLCCSASYVFSDIHFDRNGGYFPMLGRLYEESRQMGGSGLFGGILGFPFAGLLGSLGSKIVVMLLLLLTLLILTGTTLLQLFRTVSKPARSVASRVSRNHQTQEIYIPRDQREQEEEKPSRQRSMYIASENELPPKKKKQAEQPSQPEPAPAKADSGKKDLFEVTGIEKPKTSPASPASAEKLAAAKEALLEATSGQPAASQTSSPPPASSRPVPESSVQPASQPSKPAQESTAEKAAPSVPEVVPVPENADGYVFPPVSMLEPSKVIDASLELEEQQHNGQLLIQTLKSFGVQAKILDICRGPSVTRYELQPAAGVKISKITNLSDDIAMNLAAAGVRIEAPIPGKAAVGIEIPNRHRSVVRMRELIESNSFLTAKSRLTVTLGRDITGQIACADLSKMPHILIAGTTGSGKSVCINSLIISMLYKASPEEVRLLMIDPKVVELGIYNGIPHLLVPVVTDPRKASGALSWAVKEMDNRYRIFADCNVRDLAGYNHLAKENDYKDEDGQPMPAMPQIVIIIDELADLMMVASNEVEDSICRLAQKARAAGMHLVVATQRPSVDVVTGLIKANIPSRIAFTVSSPVDSRTILDTGGAEKLLGQGDMLFAPVGCQKPTRIQGCYVSDSEVESIVNFVKHTREEVSYDGAVMEEIEKNAAAEREKNDDGNDHSEQDPMLNEAIKCVVEAGQASTSLLQRRLRLGYARAGRLIDELEQLGVVGPHEGSKPRQVLMSYQQWLERVSQQPD